MTKIKVSSLKFTTGDPPLCRVPGAHGKAPKAHGKSFAVCRTRQSAHGNQGSAKPAFAVCYISGTRQRVCRVQLSTHGKKKSPPRNDDVARPLPCACRRGTRQSSNLCRVPWFLHTAKVPDPVFFLFIAYMVPQIIQTVDIYHNNHRMQSK